MVSSPDFGNSLTVESAASAHYTLKVISIVAAILLPIIAPLPGLDVPRLPSAGSAASGRAGPGRSSPEPTTLAPLRALDPRLLRRAPPVRHLLARRRRGRARHGGARPPPGDAARAHRRQALSTAPRSPTFARPRGARRSSSPRAALSPGRSRSRGDGRRGGALAAPARARRASAARHSRRRSTGPQAARSRPPRSRGSTPLEAYFARYLPQVVLALPRAARGARPRRLDRRRRRRSSCSLTLPLVPIFMWLIGRYTEERTRERWQALRLLVDPLPRRRARPADAARVQPRQRRRRRRSPTSSERYRRATMATLRVAFLSGSVLELAATLGRRARGRDGRRAARRRRHRPRRRRSPCSCSRPSSTCPLRQLGAQYHASADGARGRRAAARAAGGAAPPMPGQARTDAAAPRRGGRPARGRLLRVPRARGARPGRRRPRAPARARRSRSSAPSGSGQEHGRRAPARPRRADRRAA